MARTPIAARPAISQWLIRAREGYGMTNAQAFLDALRAETGSAPNYSTYAQWESGAATPKDASLAPVIAFWTSRGVAAPNMEPPAPERSLEERAVDAAWAQVEAIREQTDVMRQLLGALTAAASTAAPVGTSPIEAVVSQVIGRSASPLPTETHAPTG